MLGLGSSLVKGGVSSSWTPAELPDIIHWYRFNTDIGESSGVVTGWEDQVGSNNLSASGHASSAPNLTDGAVVFDSGGDVMTFGSALSLGTFAIYIRLSTDAVGGDYLFESGSSNFFQIYDDASVRVKVDGNRHDYNLDGTISEGVKFNIGWERADTALTTNDRMDVYFNNSASTQSGTGDGTQAITDLLAITTVGKPTQSSTWYEIVVCENSLSAANRTLLNTYLNTI